MAKEFGRDELSSAEEYYHEAVSADSTFALAAWRLAAMFGAGGADPDDPDLRALHDRYGDRLGPTDRRLLEALIEPDLRRRLDLLEATVVAFPGDAYARLIYGEELWHRGPLVGVDVSAARDMMATVVRTDSTLAQAYDHIIMYHIRHGEAREAKRAYRQLVRVTLPSPDDADRSYFFWLALQERFHPLVAKSLHWWLDVRHDSSAVLGLAQVARIGGPWFDLPEAQVALCGILLRHGSATDSARGSARVGIALGDLALGRVGRGLVQLDTAAAELGTTEMRLQRAEWRVIPPALGLAGWAGVHREAWSDSLESLAHDSVVGPRARWALGLARLAAGDTAAVEADEALPSGAHADPLWALLLAVRAGMRGRPGEALAISDSLRWAFEVTRPPDPFAGAAFHLYRGAWELARGRPRAADLEWLWYEASDVEGWPSAHPQAGEVDGVLGVLARSKRGELELAAGTGTDTVAACALLDRVTELWHGADAALRPPAIAARVRDMACRR